MDINNLRRILEDKSLCEFLQVSLDENQKFETFTGQRQLIPIVMAYVITSKSSYSELVDLAVRIEDSAAFCRILRDPSRYRSLFALVVSLVRQLRVVFAIPKPQMSNTSPIDWRPNDELMAFINFLNQILGKIMGLEANFVVSPVKESIEILRTELEFLITFLGDAPMRLHVERTKNVLEDITVFANQVGSFLYRIFSTLDDQVLAANRVGLALSRLLQESELLKEKAMDHCTVVSKSQGSAAIKTDVGPVFILDSLLDDLKDLIDQKSDTIGCTKELLLLRSSLDNISLAQLAEPGVVIPIRDLVYEIEYVVNSSPAWYLAVRLPQLVEKTQLIRMDIHENSKCGGIYAAREEKLAPQEKTPVLVGFRHTTTEITEKLIGGPAQQQIISLVGMSGLGKTTLANKLFNDPSIVHYFDKRAWCIVSQTYERKTLLVDILASTWDPTRENMMQKEEHQNDDLTSTKHLKREKMMQMEEDQLVEKLYKSLKRMKYLIVLDDIWDVQPWDDLEKYFPDDRTGSRILFTTRNREVGLRASPNNIITLPFLSDDECWELIQQKLFPAEPCPQELLKIGKQIATSCHGVSLSVTLIASVLANTPKNERSWKNVERSLSTHLLDNENNCLHILKLSYQHLPTYLKPCFLYFGVFKEDEVIPVRKLISHWVAEGFIKKEDNKSLEDVAHSYLINLINRGLVLISGRRSNGGIKTCIIHDLLHDMCKRIAVEENIMKDIKGLSKHEQDVDRWECRPSTRPFDPYQRSHLGRRILDLGRSLDSYGHISRVFEQMVHLRYLGVGYELPSIESSNKLECIFVWNRKEHEIPKTLLTTANLRHLHFEGGACFSESFCLRAKKDNSFQMKNIQSISTLCIYNEMDAQVLGCAPNLLRLKCEFKNQCPSFNFPNQLESLNITTIPDPCPNFPVNLRKLTLNRFFLSWEKVRMIGRLENLEVLKLRCGTIKENTWETEEDEFKTLRFLELSEVRIVEPYDFAEWSPETDHYPRLQRLVLRKCHCLMTIPSTLGHISTLQTIEVHGCAPDIAKSAMDILKEQKEEYDNKELKVIITRDRLGYNM